jgi:alpha-glucosidase
LRSIFHTLDDGRKINHYDVHNLYGTSMVRATSEGLARLNADKRSFVVGRSSYPGLHRYAVLWTGDNSSWWEHMLVQLRMVLSLNMAGFFYCGGDVGGFGGDSSPELCVRWTQLGCFTPLFRNHSTKGSRAQEPWAFDSESLGIMRNFIRVRYAMLPFIYSEYRSAVEHSSPFISPLFLHFGDEAVKEIEDQFMFGSALMVAPVLTQNAHRRFVYLPECRWLQWNIKAWDRREVQVRDPGSYFIAAPLDELPVFLRENSLLPLTEPRRHCGEAISPDLVVIAFVTKQAAFTLIHDDGESLGFSRGETSRLHLSVTKNGDHFSPSVRAENHAACPLPYKKVFFEIYDGTGKLHRLEQQIV